MENTLTREDITNLLKAIEHWENRISAEEFIDEFKKEIIKEYGGSKEKVVDMFKGVGDNFSELEEKAIDIRDKVFKGQKEIRKRVSAFLKVKLYDLDNSIRLEQDLKQTNEKIK